MSEQEVRMLATIVPVWPNCMNKVSSYQGVDVLRLISIVARVKLVS